LVDHDGGVTTYLYDAGNRLRSVSNPFGEVTTWTWDALGRVEQPVLGNR